MKDYQSEGLSHDPVHGYIPFISRVRSDTEVAEREIIDHPWVQRLRQIHQLQTAWWVYPTAEHTRFQHVIGAMHLASRLVDHLYDSLRHVANDVPSRGYVECLMRMAALLHDVGHGPFGHFFDVHFLADFGLTHELLGAVIIRQQLGELLSGVRQCPQSRLEPGETLDPDQIAYLIQRPQAQGTDTQPTWLRLLRSLFCGIYTADNMDFVLRDAFMTGYSTRAFDLERLLHYSFFSDAGLTIHARGMDALIRFMQARADLFRAVYFHRTVRAIDLTLESLFLESKSLLFPDNPRDNLTAYLRFTEWSLLVDVARWATSEGPRRHLGGQWQALLGRQLQWRAACERNVVFVRGESEAGSIFADENTAGERIRNELPAEWKSLELRADLPRHIHRPHTRGPVARQNFLYDAAKSRTRPLTDDQLFRQLPAAHRSCRIYVPRRTDTRVDHHLAVILDRLLGNALLDDVTNI